LHTPPPKYLFIAKHQNIQQRLSFGACGMHLLNQHAKIECFSILKPFIAWKPNIIYKDKSFCLVKTDYSFIYNEKFIVDKRPILIHLGPVDKIVDNFGTIVEFMIQLKPINIDCKGFYGN
jgi:hypothetical protein